MFAGVETKMDDGLEKIGVGGDGSNEKMVDRIEVG
jgi:hypothetical protein